MLTASDTFVFMLLQNYGVRKLEAFFMSLIGFMAICFWIEMFQSDPDVGEIISGMLLPSVPSTAVIQAVAMIGAGNYYEQFFFFFFFFFFENKKKI
jgi:NRAMP (natural resistance-associated macrophage protein)-like metal ion transporter